MEIFKYFCFSPKFMKGLIFYLMILTAVLISTPIWAAFGLYVHCDNFLCVEGTEVKFEFLFQNTLNESIIVYNILIVDENTRENLALFDETYVIPPEGVHDVNLTTKIRRPIEGYTFFLKPCIKVGFEGSNESKYVCGEIGRQLTVTPREKVDCIKDNDCSVGYSCSERYSCNPLECQTHEAVLDHSCAKLVCKKGEEAINNQCVKVGIYAISAIYWIIGIIILLLVIIILFSKTKKNKDYTKDTEKEEKSEKRKRKKSRSKRRS
jgi:hypothetical protein